MELKRDDWRGALAQAASHVAAVDASWVALDRESSCAAVKAAAAFAHAGVGLVLLSRWADGCEVGERLKVAVQTPNAWFGTDAAARAVLAERCLAMRMRGEASDPLSHVFGRDLDAEALLFA